MTPTKQSTTPTSTPNPAVVAAAVQPAVPAKTKQQVMVETIIAGLVERKKIASAKKVEVKQEGAKIVLVIGPTWPVVEVGRAGGVNLPGIKSYANALECVWVGDEKLAAQNAREAKALAAKAIPPAVEAKKPNAAAPTAKAEPAKAADAK